jgi:hypothetical protein
LTNDVGTNVVDVLGLYTVFLFPLSLSFFTHYFNIIYCVQKYKMSRLSKINFLVDFFKNYLHITIYVIIITINYNNYPFLTMWTLFVNFLHQAAEAIKHVFKKLCLWVLGKMLRKPLDWYRINGILNTILYVKKNQDLALIFPIYVNFTGALKKWEQYFRTDTLRQGLIEWNKEEGYLLFHSFYEAKISDRWTDFYFCVL